MEWGNISVEGVDGVPTRARLHILHDNGVQGVELEREVIAILSELEEYPITAVDITRAGEWLEVVIRA